jgi:hypothetical protein
VNGLLCGGEDRVVLLGRAEERPLPVGSLVISRRPRVCAAIARASRPPRAWIAQEGNGRSQRTGCPEHAARYQGVASTSARTRR